MPNYCIVVGCSSNSAGDRIGFFRIPGVYDNNKRMDKRRLRRRNEWIKAIARADLTKSKVKYERVCSNHFVTGKPARLQDEDNPDWIPSLQMRYSSLSASMGGGPRRKVHIEDLPEYEDPLKEEIPGVNTNTRKMEVASLSDNVENGNCDYDDEEQKSNIVIKEEITEESEDDIFEIISMIQNCHQRFKSSRFRLVSLRHTLREIGSQEQWEAFLCKNSKIEESDKMKLEPL